VRRARLTVECAGVESCLAAMSSGVRVRHLHPVRGGCGTQVVAVRVRSCGGGVMMRVRKTVRV